MLARTWSLTMLLSRTKKRRAVAPSARKKTITATSLIAAIAAVSVGCSAADEPERAAVATAALGSPPDTLCTSTTYGAHTYWFCNNTRSWATARSKCEAVGLNLVRIDSSAENDFVQVRIALSLWADGWIGANDTASEGVWQWSFDGSNFWNGTALGPAVPGMFSRWALLQPDNFLNQDCARIKPDGFWEDEACSVSKRYVCESGADLCPNDPQKVDLGICGCGVPDVDSDGDGVLNCHEQCPNDPTKLVPGDCGCADSPRPAGTPCNDGLCATNTTCAAAGVCGNPASCTPPDSSCRFNISRNTYYWFCDNDRSFADARQRCQAAGMDLATVQNRVEDDFITLNIFEHTLLGGTDQALEGDWVWLSNDTTFWTGGPLGTPLAGAYTNWGLLEPSDGLLGQDCMVKDPPIELGQWHTRSCLDIDAFACEGQPADGTPSQDLPDTPPLGPTNLVTTASGSGTSVVDYPVCEPGLSLLTQGDQPPDRQTTLEHEFEPTDSCAYRECNEDNSNPTVPTDAELNALPESTDVCAGMMASLVCGIDPATVDMTPSGVCVDDSSCISTGHVCAVVCQNEACTVTERRCAQQMASCRGLPEEESCKDVRQCAAADYTGDPVPGDAALGIRPPNDLERQPDAPAELTNPDQSTLPANYPKGDLCVSSLGAAAELPEQLEPREAHSGNTKWGIFAHPEVSFKGKMNPLAIGGEAELDFSADASFTAGAYVWGKEHEAIEARASATIDECDFQFARSLELFGAPIDIGSPGSDHPNSDCTLRMLARQKLVRDVKFHLYKAITVKQYVEQFGFTQELCLFTYSNLASPYVLMTNTGCQQIAPCPDLAGAQTRCSTAAGREGAAREWLVGYAQAIDEYRANQIPLDAAKQALTSEIPDPLEVHVGHEIGFAPPPIIVPIGPVHVTIELEIVGGWGLAGRLGMILNRNPASQVGATAQVVPDFDLTALAFAGVGFGPVSFGVAGALLLLDAEAPLQTSLEFSQVAGDDLRPKDFPTAPTAFPTQRYRWNGKWSLGSRVDLSTLKGHIDLQARVRFLFFKKTFSQKIADWAGHSETYDFLGADLPLQSPAGLNFGDFGEETAYVDPGWLSTNLTGPATPIPTAVPDILKRVCGPPPPQ